MRDELFWNKVFGAVLATLLVIVVLRQTAEMVFTTTPPAKPGDAIAVQTAAADAGPAVDTPPDWGTVLPTADVAAGQVVSQKCLSCHSFNQGGPNQTGPNNWGVIGRQPGSHPGFAYSQAMTDFGQKVHAWDYDHLYLFLASPQGYINGTKMSFVGLKQPQDRINLIAWLRTQSATPAPIPPPKPAAAAPATSGPGTPPENANPSSDKPAAVSAAPAGPASGASTSVSSQTGKGAAAAEPSSSTSSGGAPH
jgi:cytochrome c